MYGQSPVFSFRTSAKSRPEPHEFRTHQGLYPWIEELGSDRYAFFTTIFQAKIHSFCAVWIGHLTDPPIIMYVRIPSAHGPVYASNLLILVPFNK